MEEKYFFNPYIFEFSHLVANLGMNVKTLFQYLCAKPKKIKTWGANTKKVTPETGQIRCNLET